MTPACTLTDTNDGDDSSTDPTVVTIACTNAGSLGPTQIPFAYSIDWGDSTSPSTGSWDPTAGNLVPTHNYAAEGTYTVTPTLTPADGGTVSLTPATVSVSPTAAVTPTCTLTDTNDGDVSGTNPTAVTIACSNAGSLGPTQIPFAYSVDWGDGSSPSTGSWDPTGGDLVLTHNYTVPSTYVVTPTLTPADGAAVSLTPSTVNVSPTG